MENKNKTPKTEAMQYKHNSIVNFAIDQIKEWTKEIKQNNKDAEYKEMRNKYYEQYMKIYDTIEETMRIEAFETKTKDLEERKEGKDDSKHEENAFNFWKSALINTGFFHFLSLELELLDYLSSIKILFHLPTINYTITFNFLKNKYITNSYLSLTFLFSDVTESLTEVNNDKIIWNDDQQEQQYWKEMNENNSSFDNFLNLFPDSKCVKGSDTDMKLYSNRARFFKSDFFPNILEFALDLIPTDSNIEQKLNELEPIKTRYN